MFAVVVVVWLRFGSLRSLDRCCSVLESGGLVVVGFVLVPIDVDVSDDEQLLLEHTLLLYEKANEPNNEQPYQDDDDDDDKRRFAVAEDEPDDVDENEDARSISTEYFDYSDELKQ